MAASMKVTSSVAAPHKLQRADRGRLVVRSAQVDTKLGAAVKVVEQGAVTLRYVFCT